MKDLLRKIAWKYANQAHAQNLNVDYEELFAEANLAYLEALRTYDESKAKLTTHLWHTVSGRLQNYLKEELKQKGIPFEEVEVSQSYVPYFEKLTKDAQEVAKVILNAPDEFVCLTKQDLRKKVIREMLNLFPLKKINRGIKDLSLIYS